MAETMHSQVVLRAKCERIFALAFLISALASAHAGAGHAEHKQAASSESSDTLEFLNGDLLHGKLIAVGPEFLTWQPAAAGRAMEFHTAGLANVRFAQRSLPLASSLAPNNVRVGLTNGDEIPGTLVALTGDKLELQTPYAGKISIPRKLLKFVAPARVSAAAIYEGPTGMQGWKTAEGEPVWHFQKDAFVAQASGAMGREMEWPDKLSIEFDLSWRGSLGFALGLGFTSLKDDEGDGYLVMLGEGSVDLMRSRKGNTEEVGTAADAPVLSQNDRTHVKIYLNKKTRTVSLLLDGVHVRQWTDRADFKLRGKFLGLASQSEALTRVSKIRVAAWNGRIEAEEMETAEQNEDVLRLVNGDRVSGKLQTIQGGHVSFYTTHGSLTVPLAKIEDITLPARMTPRMEKRGEVRAFFSGAGRLTMALEKWDAKLAAVTLAAGGRATVSTTAFQRLEFHAASTLREDEDEFAEPPRVESPP